MVDPSECERARAEFLIQYIGDRDLGRMGGLEHYQRMFPGCEQVVEQEWRRLGQVFAGQGDLLAGDTGMESAGRDNAGATSGPARNAALGADPGSLALGAATTIGPYRLLRELGRGAQGTVFLAKDTRIERSVALKILKVAWSGSEVLARRFRLEAQALARLSHPGLVQVYETGSSHGLDYIAMGFVEGQTLAQERVKQSAKTLPGRAQISRYVGIFERCARALHVAHEAGLVHRDVKPANIMISRGDEPVLLDFGIALVAEPGAEALTSTGDLLGTPDFMAPEQIAGERERIDRRTDVYALGMTMRVMIGGARHQNPAIARDLEAIVRVATDPDPDRRYGTAEALAADLARFNSGAPVAVRPPGWPSQLLRQARRHPAAAALVVVPTLLLAAGALGLAVGNRAIRASARELAQSQALARAAALQATQESLAFQRLEDLRLVAELEQRELLLWPATPERVPELERWLADAARLLERLDGHRQALDELRRNALPVKTAVGSPGQAVNSDPEGGPMERARWVLEAARAELQAPELSAERSVHLRRTLEVAAERLKVLEVRAAANPTWKFVRAEDQWVHDNLAQLVERLELLDAGGSTGADSREIQTLGQSPRASIRARLASALTLEQRSLVEPATSWAAAIAAIADPQASPAYQGLRIAPILGLIPIGPDPQSKLWEFAHLPSGTPPRRDAAGRLQIDAESSIVLVLIPGGSFSMGARPSGDPGEGLAENQDPLALPQEQPVHRVTLDPYLISKYELTQRQWLRVAGSNPSHARPDRAWEQGYQPTLQNPVEQIAYNEALEILQRYGLDLPTEAQWEAAARAGTLSPWWPGETVASFLNDENTADRWYVQAEQVSVPHDQDRDDGWSGPAPVGSYPQNPFGLHDVIGNVAEWCRDHIDYYRVPALPQDGLRAGGIVGTRAVRGGSFNMPAKNGRSASRFGMPESTRVGWIGVRPALRLNNP
jgi:formylglycine-generating enzyme required for sulfatase activity